MHHCGRSVSGRRQAHLGEVLTARSRRVSSGALRQEAGLRPLRPVVNQVCRHLSVVQLKADADGDDCC